MTNYKHGGIAMLGTPQMMHPIDTHHVLVPLYDNVGLSGAADTFRTVYNDNNYQVPPNKILRLVSVFGTFTAPDVINIYYGATENATTTQVIQITVEEGEYYFPFSDEGTVNEIPEEQFITHDPAGTKTKMLILVGYLVDN